MSGEKAGGAFPIGVRSSLAFAIESVSRESGPAPVNRATEKPRARAIVAVALALLVAVGVYWLGRAAGTAGSPPLLSYQTTHVSPGDRSRGAVQPSGARRDLYRGLGRTSSRDLRDTSWSPGVTRARFLRCRRSECVANWRDGLAAENHVTDVGGVRANGNTRSVDGFGWRRKRNRGERDGRRLDGGRCPVSGRSANQSAIPGGASYRYGAVRDDERRRFASSFATRRGARVRGESPGLRLEPVHRFSRNRRRDQTFRHRLPGESGSIWRGPPTAAKFGSIPFGATTWICMRCPVRAR